MKVGTKNLSWNKCASNVLNKQNEIIDSCVALCHICREAYRDQRDGKCFIVLFFVIFRKSQSNSVLKNIIWRHNKHYLSVSLSTVSVKQHCSHITRHSGVITKSQSMAVMSADFRWIQWSQNKFLVHVKIKLHFHFLKATVNKGWTY